MYCNNPLQAAVVKYILELNSVSSKNPSDYISANKKP